MKQRHRKLYQGVTLGVLSTVKGQELSGVKRHPTIEYYVVIYANATILGGNTVIGKTLSWPEILSLRNLSLKIQKFPPIFRN